MPSTAHSRQSHVARSAPRRGRRLSWPLVFALVGAPAGWMAQLLFAFATTSYLCAVQAAGPVPGWLWPVVFLLNFAALALGAAAFSIAVVLLRRVMKERRSRSGDVLEMGEGLRRFFALWGAFTSLVFIVATLANSFSLFLVPLCKI